MAIAWRSEDPDGGTDLSGLRASNRAEFDAWLAAHDREVGSKALALAAEAVYVRMGFGLFESPDQHREAMAKWLRDRAAEYRAVSE
ncbi:hypothetical protein [Cryobacterium sp. Y57]|uniref:hypothetical protein n=1 Tax=Cryobacterium sp. Y57 TaxID=2048287 RepID=UPI000CE469ED|nr:hypothetical protein [Cryobacterium sp. Y57]